jgi:hypothetical protein
VGKESGVTAPKAEVGEEKPGRVDAAEFEYLISMIGRLSPSKRGKLERIIEKLESSESLSDTSSLLSTPARNQDPLRPYIAPQRPSIKNSEVRENNSKSRSKMEKVEKATSLKGSLVARIPYTATAARRDALTPTGKQDHPQENILEMEEAKSQLMSGRHQHTKDVSPIPAKNIKFTLNQEDHPNSPPL